MLLNMNDPESIVRWWTVLPERHDGVLAQMLVLRPQFALAIKEARRRIGVSAEMQAMLRRSVGEREQQEAYQAERTARMSSVEMLRRELVTG